MSRSSARAAASDADGAPTSLGTATRRAAVAGAASQAAIQLSSTAATLVLARLLTPADFGIVALCTSLVALFQFLSLAGLATAVLAQPPDRERDSTFFWAAAAAAALAVLLLCAAAPWATALLGQPGAAPYVYLLAPVLVLSAAVGVPQAVLRRELRFRAYQRSVTWPALIYFAVEVVLAVGGLGPAAVLIGQGAGALTASVLALAAWRPQAVLRVQHLRQSGRFALGISGTQVLAYLQKNVDFWAVSTFVGAAGLGLYYIAYVLPSILRLRISWVTQAVLLPAFARTRDDPAAAGAAWRKAWLVQVSAGLPALVGIGVLADPLVALLFGERWSGAVPALQLLAVSAVLDLHLSLGAALASVTGHLRTALQVSAARTVLVTAGTWWAAASGSLELVAAAVLASAALGLVWQDVLLGRVAPVGLRVVSREATGLVLAAVGMAGVLALAVDRLDVGPVPMLLLLVPTGASVYVALLALSSRALLRELRAEYARLLRPGRARGLTG